MVFAVALPSPSPNSTAIVTGASSGIGAALARELARRGHGVSLVARRADRLEEVAAELRGLGVRIEVMAADLSDRTVRAGLLGQIEDRGLIPDILVNSAGLSTLGRVAVSDPEVEMHMIEVDVVAVVDLCSRLLPGMVARRRGAILNVASTAAFQPLPGQAGYGACKAFVLSYSHSLSGELRDTGVTVTALCPGPVDTGFGETAGLTKEEAEEVSSGLHVGDTRGGGKSWRGRHGQGPCRRHPRVGQPGWCGGGLSHPEERSGSDLGRPASRDAPVGQRAPRTSLPGRSPVSSPWAKVVTPVFIVSTYPVAPCNSRVPRRADPPRWSDSPVGAARSQ